MTITELSCDWPCESVALTVEGQRPVRRVDGGDLSGDRGALAGGSAVGLADHVDRGCDRALPDRSGGGDGDVVTDRDGPVRPVDRGVAKGDQDPRESPAEAARAGPALWCLVPCVTRSFSVWRFALMLTMTPETRVVCAACVAATALDEPMSNASTVAQDVRNRRFNNTGNSSSVERRFQSSRRRTGPAVASWREKTDRPSSDAAAARDRWTSVRDASGACGVRHNRRRPAGQRFDTRRGEAMARFVLVHGAFGGAWSWEPNLGELERAGHT